MRRRSVLKVGVWTKKIQYRHAQDGGEQYEPLVQNRLRGRVTGSCTLFLSNGAAFVIVSGRGCWRKGKGAAAAGTLLYPFGFLDIQYCFSLSIFKVIEAWEFCQPSPIRGKTAENGHFSRFAATCHRVEVSEFGLQASGGRRHADDIQRTGDVHSYLPRIFPHPYPLKDRVYCQKMAKCAAFMQNDYVNNVTLVRRISKRTMQRHSTHQKGVSIHPTKINSRTSAIRGCTRQCNPDRETTS